MSLPRYIEYKNTGLTWAKRVPSHWAIKRLRFVAQLNPSKSAIAEVDRAIQVSFLPMEAIGDDGSLNLERTRPISEVESGYTYFRDGDVTLAKITPCFENGKGALMQGLEGGIGFGTTELIVARPNPTEVTGKLLSWIFRSPNFRAQGEASMYGAGGQKRVPGDFVRDFAWAFPPLNEQTSITAFLDRETAKIDALIAEQEKLIALLAEKRQAIISHAVTRGLNPNAPMKDSGVAWLGEVPAHWEIKRFGDACTSLSTGPFGTALGSNDYVDGGVPVINPSHIVDNSIDSDDAVSVSRQTADRLSFWALRTGDLVVARRGELGRAAVVKSESDGWICGTGSLRVTPHKTQAAAGFLHAILQSTYAREWLNQASVGSTMANLNEGILGRLPIALPRGIDEQEQTTTELSEKLSGIEATAQLAEECVALLQERRTALIAAAVTGKIDVRDALGSLGTSLT